MQSQTIGSSIERPAVDPEPGLDARFPGKYLSLTSFKRDGTGVATPVWFVVDGGVARQDRPGIVQGQADPSNPAVMIAPCSASGRLRGEPCARAQILSPGNRIMPGG